MYKTISYTEAKEKFSSILREAEQGQGYLVTKKDVPVAKIEGMNKGKPANEYFKGKKGKSISKKDTDLDADSMFGLWKDDPRTTDEIVRDLRKKAWLGWYLEDE